MAKTTDKAHYLVHYRDPRDGNHQSLKAKKIKDSSLGLSFVSISDFVFEENSPIVNPEEEAKKLELENVKTLHLSIYSILSISELGPHKKDLSFKKDKSNLLVLSNEPSGSPSN